MPNTFRPHEHLRRPSDFRRVYQDRCSASNQFLLIYACKNDLLYSRIGLSVSRKVGPATHRNRLRRLYREAFRLLKADLPTGLDLVLIPRMPETPSLEELKQTLALLTGQLAKRLSERHAP